MKTTITFLILILLISCKQDEIKDKVVKWDFTSSEFDQEVRLLNRYDVFTFTKQSDSMLMLQGAVFKGWKNKSLELRDTLKLIENYFILDSVGNRTKQILSYSKKNQTYFQLIITKNELTYLAFEKTDKKTSDYTLVEETLKTDIGFSYEGKLFINKNNVQYFSEYLYTK